VPVLEQVNLERFAGKMRAGMKWLTAAASR
jgi:hypothetical protein